LIGLLEIFNSDTIGNKDERVCSHKIYGTLYKFFNCRIQSILTDNGLEFTNIRGAPGSHILDEFCLKNSGKHKLTRKRRETNEW